MRILSVDPGDRTGIAKYDTQSNDFYSWETPDNDRALLCFEYDVLAYDVVIIENFIINAGTVKKTRPKRHPLETIGAVRYICMKLEKRLVIQTPSEKDWCTDTKLKKLNWYKPSSDNYAGHANDAARHIGVYLGVKKQDQEFLRKLV